MPLRPTSLLQAWKHVSPWQSSQEEVSSFLIGRAPRTATLYQVRVFASSPALTSSWISVALISQLRSRQDCDEADVPPNFLMKLVRYSGYFLDASTRSVSSVRLSEDASLGQPP